VDDSLLIAPSIAQSAGSLPPLTTPVSSTPGVDVRGRAAVLYGRMRDAMRRGDWTAFGQAFDELGKLLGGGSR